MPELPEVETIRCQLEKQIKNKTIKDVIIRNKRLRWPIPKNLKQILKNQIISSVIRRGKYLILNNLHIHLGMSGSVQIVPKSYPIKKHDHVDIIFNNGKCLRFNDPRRFGAILLDGHKLLDKLGPEPLTDEFHAKYLYQHSRKRKIAIKQFIMDGSVVAGIGNIYANEALFSAGIDPRVPAEKISQQKYKTLTDSIKQVLALAIKCNGTTFRNFISSNGQPGSFKIRLKVYGREGLPCMKCKTPIKKIKLGQRSTFFCCRCQKPA